MLKNRRAFTLIELLVVITVITLLMAVLLPSLRRAKEQMRALVCKSQLRSMYRTLSLYADDHNSRLFGKSEDYNLGTFYCLLVPYVEQIDELSLCPSAKYRKDNKIAEGIIGSAEQPWVWAASSVACPGGLCKLPGCIEYGSYTFNGYLYNAKAPRDSSFGKEEDISQPKNKSDWYSSIDRITSTSMTPCFADGIWLNGWPEEDDTPPLRKADLSEPDETYCTGMLRFCIDRHRKTVGMAFIDGHVDSVSLPELWQQKWYKGFGTQTNIVMPTE